MKKFVRVIITRLMPVEKRMSDDFFHKLTLRSTIIGSLITFGTAGFLYWAIGRGEAYFFPARPKVTYADTPLPAPRPIAIPIPAPVIDSPDSIPIQAIPSEPPHLPQQYNGERVYLQIYAFRHLPAAQRQQAIWSGRDDIQVILAYAASDTEPYKVLLGPFSSSATALRFRRRQGLDEGFPRTLKDLMPFSE